MIGQLKKYLQIYRVRVVFKVVVRQFIKILFDFVQVFAVYLKEALVFLYFGIFSQFFFILETNLKKKKLYKYIQ